MSRSVSVVRAHHRLAAVAVLLTLLVAGPAAAQGTMTPTQPPPAATGTPNQPPPTPTQPPPVAPAQPAPPPPTASNPSAAGAAAQTSPVEEEEKSDAPKARRGFQMALRTGVQIPIGELEKNGKMSDFTGVQVPIIVDLGGKIIPNLFLGGYLGISVGGAAGKLADTCEKADLSCTSIGARIGAQIQYHINPEGKINPWVGYGIGYELLGVSGEGNNTKLSAATAGVEFAHIMAGADFRISKGFGIGPFADFSIGQYSVATIEATVNGTTTKRDGDIENTALHQWLMIGARFVFFP